jgi:hypothetical protein
LEALPHLFIASMTSQDDFGSVPVQKLRLSMEDGGHLLGYQQGDQLCSQLELDCPIAKDFSKYQLIIKELEFCHALITYSIQKDGEFPLGNMDAEDVSYLPIRSAYTAAVVSYGKIFSRVGIGRKKLDRSEVFKGDGEKYLKFHSWIMENNRHQYVAHAQSQTLEITRTVAVMPGSYRASTHPWVISHAMFRPAYYPREAKDFLRLVEFVHAWVMREHEKLAFKLHQNFGEIKPEHYAKAVSFVRVAPWPEAPRIPE